MFAALEVTPQCGGCISTIGNLSLLNTIVYGKRRIYKTRKKGSYKVVKMIDLLGKFV